MRGKQVLIELQRCTVSLDFSIPFYQEKGIKEKVQEEKVEDIKTTKAILLDMAFAKVSILNKY
jgi:hypothetical protein